MRNPAPQNAAELEAHETREWLESLDYVLQSGGPARVGRLLRELSDHARRRGDAELQQREGQERALGREANAAAPAPLGAEAEAGHESRHDDRDRDARNPRQQRQQALPRDLIDEGCGPAQEEEEGGDPRPARQTG